MENKTELESGEAVSYDNCWNLKIDDWGGVDYVCFEKLADDSTRLNLQCYNLTWPQVTKILDEVKRMKQTEEAYEGATTSGKRLKTGVIVECFRWVVQNVDGGMEVRKSPMVYMTMKNCLAAASNEVLEENNRINYITEDVEITPSKLLKKVFLYLFRLEYIEICQKKCMGCKNDTLIHEKFCIEHEDPQVDIDFGSRALEKISTKRTLNNVLKVHNLFNLPKTNFTLTKCQIFADEFDKYDYDQMLSTDFEYELNLMDDM